MGNGIDRQQVVSELKGLMERSGASWKDILLLVANLSDTISLPPSCLNCGKRIYCLKCGKAPERISSTRCWDFIRRTTTTQCASSTESGSLSPSCQHCGKKIYCPGCGEWYIKYSDKVRSECKAVMDKWDVVSTDQSYNLMDKLEEVLDVGEEVRNCLENLMKGERQDTTTTSTKENSAKPGALHTP